MSDTGKLYLLVKRGLYWRPNAQGYTGIKSEAGLYSEAESFAYAAKHTDGATYRVPAADADDFAPACSDADRARHWQQRAEGAEAERAALAAMLEPFARIADAIALAHPGWDHDGFYTTFAGIVTNLAPFRRARAALPPPPQPAPSRPPVELDPVLNAERN